jgi:hypothetical protein
LPTAADNPRVADLPLGYLCDEVLKQVQHDFYFIFAVNHFKKIG